MSKLTFASLAVLCTLLISCSKQELDLDSISEMRLETRSADNISVKFTTLTGTDTTFLCTWAGVDYRDNTSAAIQLSFEDGSSYSAFGNNILFSVSENYILDITTQNNHTYEVSDFSASACNAALCYSSNSGNITGTTLGFIVEDEPDGI